MSHAAALHAAGAAQGNGAADCTGRQADGADAAQGDGVGNPAKRGRLMSGGTSPRFAALRVRACRRDRSGAQAEGSASSAAGSPGVVRCLMLRRYTRQGRHRIARRGRAAMQTRRLRGRGTKSLEAIADGVSDGRHLFF